MKLKIDNLPEFKKDLIAHILKEWQTDADRLEIEWKQKIQAASPALEPYSTSSKREIAEQNARVELSQAKTPIMELKNLAQNQIPGQKDDKIGPFTLFDITTTELSIDNTTTYFLLPIQSLPKFEMRTNWNGHSIELLAQGSRFRGLSLNYSEEEKGGEIWEEPAMGRIISTGRFTNDVKRTITAIYK